MRFSINSIKDANNMFAKVAWDHVNKVKRANVGANFCNEGVYHGDGCPFSHAFIEWPKKHTRADASFFLIRRPHLLKPTFQPIDPVFADLVQWAHDSAVWPLANAPEGEAFIRHFSKYLTRICDRYRINTPEGML